MPKKLIITSTKSIQENLIPIDAAGVMTSILTCEESMSVSDGSHTLEEIYAHRYALYCMMAMHFPSAWKSKRNADESEWEGYFCAGLDLGDDGQCPISYHLPMLFWELCPGLELNTALWADKHTAEDVYVRLMEYLITAKGKQIPRQQSRLTYSDADRLTFVEGKLEGLEARTKENGEAIDDLKGFLVTD